MIGPIEKGKAADFIAMKQNPLENRQAFRTIEMVVAQGRMIRQPKVKKMEQVQVAGGKVQVIGWDIVQGWKI